MRVRNREAENRNMKIVVNITIQRSEANPSSSRGKKFNKKEFFGLLTWFFNIQIPNLENSLQWNRWMLKKEPPGPI